MHSDFVKIARHIENQRSEAIQLMKNIISIKALGPQNNGVGEMEKAEFLQSYLKTIGIKEIEGYPAPDPAVPGGMRPNLIGRIPGKNKEKTIWIMSHLDVVPAGDLNKWKTDPFEAVVKDGRIYGRGTEDNSQGMVSSIMMAKAFCDLGIKPQYNIALLLVCDEETGSDFGLEYMLNNHAELFSEDDIYIVPDAGIADGSMIEVAEKSLLWMKFTTKGSQVHASLPGRGVNAFKAASHLIVELEKLYSIYDGRNEVFDPPISTFEPTKKEGNVPNVNTIPGQDVFFMDCRVLPRYQTGNVLKDARKICDKIEIDFSVKIDLHAEMEEQAAPATSVDAVVVKALKGAIAEVYNIEAKAMGIGGGTVASIFRRAGLDVAVWSTIDDTAHQPNEYCIIANMLSDAKVFGHVCLQEF